MIKIKTDTKGSSRFSAYDVYEKSSLMALISIGSTGRLHLLLVDDDDDDRELFATALKTTAPDVQFSSLTNGKQLMDALGKAKPSELPDVILLDLNMPIKSGSDCLVEIRANQNLRNIPVVIYSTSTRTELMEEMREKGANYYICKPSAFNDLKTIIQKIATMPWRGSDNSHKSGQEGFVLFKFK